MILLAFDTSTRDGSVALRDGAGRVHEVAIGTSVRHAESLLPAIATVLGDADLAPADLNAILVSAGPGSFTGVRIAAATARGMVGALDIPLYAYGSLLAEAAAPGVMDRPVCALFDARRGEVYAACYRFIAGDWNTLLTPDARPLTEVVAGVPENTLWVGEGALRYAERLPVDAEIAGSSADTRAGAMIRLWTADTERGRVDATHWEPDYLRAPGAERPSQ